jgi:hypothetical protein
MTNAANQIWPNLKSDVRPKQQQRAQSLADALYPSLAPQVKAHDDWRERHRQSLLQGLRETTARLKGR